MVFSEGGWCPRPKFNVKTSFEGKLSVKSLGGAVVVKRLVKDDQSALTALKSGRAGIVKNEKPHKLAVWRRSSR